MHNFRHEALMFNQSKKFDLNSFFETNILCTKSGRINTSKTIGLLLFQARSPNNIWTLFKMEITFKLFEMIYLLWYKNICHVTHLDWLAYVIWNSQWRVLSRHPERTALHATVVHAMEKPRFWLVDVLHEVSTGSCQIGCSLFHELKIERIEVKDRKKNETRLTSRKRSDFNEIDMYLKQATPSPLYPALQAQVKDLQCWCTWHQHGS